MTASASGITDTPAASEFAQDVLAGLSAPQKQLPSKYFYDSVGSELFERITRLPEYYPTRCEIGILQQQAGGIASGMPPRAALVEFGSGSSTKTRIVLAAASSLAAYVPIDISGPFLRQQVAGLGREYPGVAMFPVEADFTEPFALPQAVRTMPRVGFFPGSTIGNFDPRGAAAFLRHAARMLSDDATFIVGVDLVKDIRLLEDAYNDAQGVTAQFNLNLLARINRELGADFDLDGFQHKAFFNREHSRIEMHLASRRRQTVEVCGTRIDFAAGETIHTENSYKYSVPSFAALARSAGWNTARTWTDAGANFSVHVLRSEDA